MTYLLIRVGCKKKKKILFHRDTRAEFFYQLRQQQPINIIINVLVRRLRDVL